jgi:hypothetical protein
MLKVMSTHAPLISGPSFLGRGDSTMARESFEDAHETLDVAEGEIKRLYAIITDTPAREREANRLLRLLAERVVLGTIALKPEEVEDLRRWYFHERRTSAND